MSNDNDYLTFLLITLKAHEIHYLFTKSIPFTFFAILFSKGSCGVQCHVLAIRK